MDSTTAAILMYGDSHLEHAGIKGMKWGVWRSESAKRKHGVAGSKKKKKSASKVERERVRAAKKKAKNNVKIAKIKANAAKKKAKYAKQTKLSMQEAKAVEAAKKRSQTKMSEVKRASDMTNEELQAALNRYNLEKSYSKMIQEQYPTKKSPSSRASEYAVNKLIKAGDQAVDAALREVFVNAALSQVKKKNKN